MYSPLEQFEINILKYPFFIFEFFGVPFTNFLLFFLLFFLFFISFSFASLIKTFVISPTRQYILESIYLFVYSMLSANLSRPALKFFPIVFFLFLVITLFNLCGLFPYSYTLTSQIVFACSLSFSVFFGLLIFGIFKHKLNFLALFFPSQAPLGLAFLLVPIEIVSFFSRPFSLAIRLFANMTAGHVLLKIISGFILILLSGLVGFVTDFGFLSLLTRLVPNLDLGSTVSYWFGFFLLSYQSYSNDCLLIFRTFDENLANVDPKAISPFEDLLSYNLTCSGYKLSPDKRIAFDFFQLFLSQSVPTPKIQILFFDSFTVRSVVVPPIISSTPSISDVLYGSFQNFAYSPLVFSPIYYFPIFYLKAHSYVYNLSSFVVGSFSLSSFNVLFAFGNLLFSLVSSLLPIFVLALFLLLELAVALLQAYVFSILTVIYIRDVFELH